NFGDQSKLINDATVTVEGVTAGWLNNHTLYQVDNVAPHYVCAHATAPGFKSSTQCRQITVADVQTQGQTQYLSIVLYPGSHPPPGTARAPDLAEPHDAGAPPDLTVAIDARAPHDAGGGITTVGGCGCAVGRARAEASHANVLVVFLVAAALMLRRKM